MQLTAILHHAGSLNYVIRARMIAEMPYEH